MDLNTVTAPLAHLSAPACSLATIGLGHVGLPLAVEFGKHRPVVAFDINPVRIVEFRIPPELGFGCYALTYFDISWLQDQIAGPALS